MVYDVVCVLFFWIASVISRCGLVDALFGGWENLGKGKRGLDR